ncbi:sensor histidine kinase [Streptomyces zaomyceticus]|uniref:sensor histidine kinase n=1 Tax=Streptomyces zaomyceticus TaxID=68286 RepID=UPI00369F96FA
MHLADLRVRHRIIALAALPLTAAVLLTAPLVAERVQSARESARSADQLRLAQEVGSLIADLQRERLFSGAYLATPGSDGNPVVRQAAQTDADVSELRIKRLDTGLPSELEGALGQVADLGQVRSLVLKRTLTPTDVNIRYGSLITGLIDALPFSATSEGKGQGDFDREHTAVEELLRVHESSSSFGVLLLGVVADRKQAAQLMADVEGRPAVATAERSRFLRVASPSEVDLFQTVESGGAAATIKTYADALTLWSYTRPHADAQQSDPPSGVTASRIFAATDSLDQLRLLVQNKIARDSAAAASDSAAKAGRWALAFVLAVLALATGIVWLTVWIARSIALPLSLLHGAAEQVAQAAEAELTRVTEDTPASADAQEPIQMMKVPNLSNDELGQLAVAFNRVQDATVALMERQVRSRENAAAMLGNVGRRAQNLAALQLSMIDSMERSETDPAVLEGLYRLDHVSSRLRRYANSLVVLSGWTETDLASSPVPLKELTRAALGKIEGFHLVQLDNIPPVSVASHVAADLALLIAELLDNATTFSPPNAAVEFSVKELASGDCLIRIVDHGVGMSEMRLAEENARLVRKERLDLVSTDSLGLFVVGRLSRRHHLEVRLEHTRSSGVTARLTLPATVLHTVADPAGNRELAGGRPQVLALPAAPGHLDSGQPQPTEAEAVHQSGATPSLSVVPSAEQWSDTVELLTSHGSGKPPLVPAGAGRFDWFNAELESDSRSVLNQEVMAMKSVRPPDSRTPLPDRERRPAGLPTRQMRSAPSPTSPINGEPALSVVPPSTVPSGGDPNRPIRLVRRVPGAQMPAGSFVPNVVRLGSEPMDPEAARAMVEEFEAGIARATQSRPSPQGDRDEKR